MNIYPKLEKEFTKEEIISQFENNEINIDFIAEYISTRDKTYNKLIARANLLEDKNNELQEQIDKAIAHIKDHIKSSCGMNLADINFLLEMLGDDQE